MTIQLLRRSGPLDRGDAVGVEMMASGRLETDKGTGRPFELSAAAGGKLPPWFSGRMAFSRYHHGAVWSISAGVLGAVLCSGLALAPGWIGFTAGYAAMASLMAALYTLNG